MFVIPIDSLVYSRLCFMQSKVSEAFIGYRMSFSFFASRTIVKAKQLFVAGVFVIEILIERIERIEWSNPLYREYFLYIFHCQKLLFVHGFFRILFLVLLPFPQRSTEVTTVKFHPVLVQYAEDTASASETADCPDVVDGVTTVVH